MSGLRLFWEDERKRPTPTKALKKLVFERDKGRCRLCGKKLDPFDFNIGHNKAHSKGGKLTMRNAILLCPPCNRSMQTLNLKQTRNVLGLPETPEEKTKKVLKELTTAQLKYLAKRHKVKVKGRVSEGLFSSSNLPPSKIQYVNALSKVLTEDKIEKNLKEIPKPTKKKRKRRNNSEWSLF